MLEQGSPMKRFGEPKEITNVILMLCSPGNTYMTGQVIAIDGGVSAF
jgi:NAD(P)-dependent dehydrogenase (short-subunit alcohol dehydrogenase family)